MSQPEISKQVVEKIGLHRFNTKDFIDLYKREFPQEWETIFRKYGAGGEGQGKSYTSHNYIGQQLSKLVREGFLLTGFEDAPEGWGNALITVWTLASKIAENPSINNSAIDDLDDAGNVAPEKRTGVNSFFVRDAEVRRMVKDRANGRCEFCGKLGFERENDERYVEAHHIIHLSKQGPDTLDNVIALCPNHHREAHYGKDAKVFENKLLLKLQSIRAK